ncbi:type A2 lantipeptide [Streptacidiphilus fuscans]|uniref:Type A2 lantipeptide n=1 Tax=Streptacidiphilus fuscans TaxID=2789292 RepID=A0A931FFV3_9ACTN|nr:type A2 lantipeptide [Streptacidiphilus fuscans]MBF9072003.1 type A2 lantipeptide [Streptacidiphilus fuscans]
MRNVTPQVETREISDNELDAVAGGAGLLGLDAVGVVTPVLGAVESVLPIGGLVAGASQLVPSQVTGLAGL